MIPARGTRSRKRIINLGSDPGTFAVAMRCGTCLHLLRESWASNGSPGLSRERVLLVALIREFVFIYIYRDSPIRASRIHARRLVWLRRSRVEITRVAVRTRFLTAMPILIAGSRYRITRRRTRTSHRRYRRCSATCSCSISRKCSALFEYVLLILVWYFKFSLAILNLILFIEKTAFQIGIRRLASRSRGTVAARSVPGGGPGRERGAGVRADVRDAATGERSEMHGAPRAVARQRAASRLATHRRAVQPCVSRSWRIVRRNGEFSLIFLLCLLYSFSISFV